MTILLDQPLVDDFALDTVQSPALYERGEEVGVRLDLYGSARVCSIHPDVDSALIVVAAGVRAASKYPDDIEDLMLSLISGLMATGTSALRLIDGDDRSRVSEIMVTVDPRVIAKLETY